MRELKCLKCDEPVARGELKVHSIPVRTEDGKQHLIIQPFHTACWEAFKDRADRTDFMLRKMSEDPAS